MTMPAHTKFRITVIRHSDGKYFHSTLYSNKGSAMYAFLKARRWYKRIDKIRGVLILEILEYFSDSVKLTEWNIE